MTFLLNCVIQVTVVLVDYRCDSSPGDWSDHSGVQRRVWDRASTASVPGPGFLRQGAILAALGGIIGITCSLLLGRLLRGLLYGIASTDPFSFAFTSVVLFIVALTASFIPARRASKVDPMTALRHD
jgi:hypothetical protein